MSRMGVFYVVKAMECVAAAHPPGGPVRRTSAREAPAAAHPEASISSLRRWMQAVAHHGIGGAAGRTGRDRRSLGAAGRAGQVPPSGTLRLNQPVRRDCAPDPSPGP